MAKDLYAVLGVDKSADQDTIKKTFRKVAAKLHPDKNPGDKNAEARFKEVSHANDVLGVDKSADQDTIKKTFRKVAAKLHPDKNPGDKNAEARFKEVSHANDVL